VISAGSVTSERERQTLDLLLTTTISPWQILSGKLRSGLRVSGWLTRFLLWPVPFACVLVSYYWSNLPAMLAYVAIVELTSLTTSNLALFCSVVFHKTSISLMTTYVAIVALFTLPLAAMFFAQTFFPAASLGGVQYAGIVSPFSAAFNVPLVGGADGAQQSPGSWPLVAGYFGFVAVLNGGLVACMIRLFQVRWRVSQ
jgi:ABC-type transport system involved in multi-copper enzyme maturation permease subunit